VDRLMRNRSVLSSNTIKGPRCFLERETIPTLLITSWSL